MGERFVEIANGDGTRTTARVRDGYGPALVLVPGTWGNMHTRGRLMERLDPDLAVVNVALAGQDDNWPPPANPSIPGFTGDVLRLVDAAGIDRFFIGGNSLGGMIAVDMLRLAPERVIGAIPIEGWTHWTVLRDAFGDDTGSTLTPEQQAFLQEERRKLLDRWDPDLRRRYGTIWREWDGRETLAATTVPVLEMWGDRGRPRPSRAAMMIPDLPNIEIAWVPGVSHSLLVEAPDLVAGLINGFIRRVCRDTEM